MRRVGSGGRGRGEAGFSLFEVALAMTVIGLIAGSILAILWRAGDTAAEIRRLDRRDEEVSRFVALLRETIEGLPPDASLSMTPPEESDSGYRELAVENSPTAFTFGEMVGRCETFHLALRPAEGTGGRNAEGNGEGNGEGGPTFDLAISRSDFVPDEDENDGMVFRSDGEGLLVADESGRYWLPLLRGVSDASWRFWDDEEQEWLDEWTDEEVMPALLEFRLVDEPESAPRRWIFAAPERVVADEEEEASSSSEAAGSGGSTTAVQPSRGGGRGSERGDGARGDGPRDGSGERPRPRPRGGRGPGEGRGGPRPAPNGGGAPSGGGGEGP